MAADGQVELTPEGLQTHEGIGQLNRMLAQLYDLIPGDGDQVRVYKGFGSPLNVIQAKVGSLYQRLDGGANTTLYVKESGTGATGWVAK